MIAFEFTEAHKEILRSTTITADKPGTIVRDFETMLSFMREGTAQLTGSHLLPLRTLEPLNAQLSRSIQHGLQRPQQKSFPHINGLFLLLRASGLTYVDATGKKPYLVVDEEVLASWQMLHETERYCTLLEAWLLRGDDAVLGEHGSFLFQPPITKWRDFFASRFGRHNQRRMEAEAGGDLSEDVRYWPTLHHLALMELFGFVRIEDAPPQEGSAWRIAAIEHTTLGDAMLALLVDEVFADFPIWDFADAAAESESGTLQSALQPYFPAWRQPLVIPEIGFQEGIYIFTVALDKNLWRRIAIPAQHTLEDLSDAILAAYRFDHDHLYRFIYPTRFGIHAEVNHPYMDEGPFTPEVQIGNLPLRPGMTMLYNYDFGDNWYFEIMLEQIDPPNPKQRRARVIEQAGEAPEQYPGW